MKPHVQVQAFTQLRYLELLGHQDGHIGQGFHGTDDFPVFVVENGGIFDHIDRAFVSVGNQAFFGDNVTLFKQSAPFLGRSLAVYFAPGAAQYPAGLADQFRGRVSGQALCRRVERYDIPDRVYDDDTVLKCIDNGFPVF